MIVCVAVPYFVAQIERRDNRRLVKTPLAIGGQPWETHPIFAFSHEVARRGVRPGIPLRQAHLLAPQAHFMPASPPHYQAVSGEIGDVIADFSSLVEPADWWRSPTHAADAISRRLPAHYFVHVDGIPLKEIVPFTQQMGKVLRERTALPPAIGVAEHKFTAQVAATTARLNHIRPIRPAAEQDFLASCSLRFLPLDRETSRRFRLLGIRTLGDLASLPPLALRVQFGQEIARWQQWALGQDDTPVQPHQAERTETVAYQFDDPLTTWEPLSHLLTQATQELAARLQVGALQARKLTLAWETEAGLQRQEQTLRQPTAAADHLADTLTQLISRETFETGITTLTISLASLTPAVPQQLTLFSPPANTEKGCEIVRRVAARHPTSRFYQAALAENGHPLPERRFRLHAAYDTLMA